MVGNNNQASPTDATYLRKIRKPLIEKKRRERMNQSITQLRALIGDTIKQNTAPLTRVDKADVLELTVSHIAKLRQQQVSLANNIHSYTAGYQECSRQVIAFLLSNGLVDSSKAAEISYHLQASMIGSQVRSSPLATQTSTPNHRIPPMGNTFTGIPSIRKISPIQGKVQNDESHFFRDHRFNDISSPTRMFSSHAPMPKLTHTSGNSKISNNTSSSLEESAHSLSFLSSSDEIHNQTGTVSIGTGSENKIGHVIPETTWRPW